MNQKSEILNPKSEIQNLHSTIRNPQSEIRVLLVDDSLIALKILEKILSSSPEIRIAGTARNGKEALELVPRLNPDVICTDLHMPVMDGLQFTKEVMAKYPKPILVLRVSLSRQGLSMFSGCLRQEPSMFFPNHGAHLQQIMNGYLKSLFQGSGCFQE